MRKLSSDFKQLHNRKSRRRFMGTEKTQKKDDNFIKHVKQ